MHFDGFEPIDLCCRDAVTCFSMTEFTGRLSFGSDPIANSTKGSLMQSHALYDMYYMAVPALCYSK